MFSLENQNIPSQPAMQFSTLAAFLALAVSVSATSGPGEEIELRQARTLLSRFLATFYDPDGGLGACGNPIQNSDFAVALTSPNYDNGAHCGQPITVTCQ